MEGTPNIKLYSLTLDCVDPSALAKFYAALLGWVMAFEDGEYALDCGATVAKAQFSEHWRVMLDPSGHPFCQCHMKDIFQSAHFALR